MHLLCRAVPPNTCDCQLCVCVVYVSIVPVGCNNTPYQYRHRLFPQIIENITFDTSSSGHLIGQSRNAMSAWAERSTPLLSSRDPLSSSGEYRYYHICCLMTPFGADSSDPGSASMESVVSEVGRPGFTGRYTVRRSRSGRISGSAVQASSSSAGAIAGRVIYRRR